MKGSAGSRINPVRGCKRPEIRYKDNVRNPRTCVLGLLGKGPCPGAAEGGRNMVEILKQIGIVAAGCVVAILAVEGGKKLIEAATKK